MSVLYYWERHLLTQNLVLLFTHMKRSGFLNKFLAFMIGANLCLTGCYQPVANTSDELDNDDDPELTETAANTNDSNEIVDPKDDTISSTNTMEPIGKQPKRVTGFRNNLTEHVARYGHTIRDVVDESNSVERRILNEYGAVFLTKAVPPSKVMFTSDFEVDQFQAKAGVSNVNIGGIRVELQSEASKALLAASSEARQQGLNITPRDPTDSARRSYAQTRKLWNGRFNGACEHWQRQGKLTAAKVKELKSMPIKQQVAAVLELEESGIYFSTDFRKSILYSVAAPGTSQHLSMLAFDVKEFGSERVRSILAKHGWFRTVQSDAPHFTYLGYRESDLESLGLKKISVGGFWIPNV